MISFELFSNQEICHIDLNGEKIISTVSTYIKKSLRIVEIENKKCQKFSKLKTPVEAVSDKLIMFLEGIPTSNEYSTINHTKYTAIKRVLLFWMRYSKIISMIHCYTMCYVIIVHHLVLNQ